MDFYQKIIDKAIEDAKAGTFRSDEYKYQTERMVYSRKYLAEREKMGLLGQAGRK